MKRILFTAIAFAEGNVVSRVELCDLLWLDPAENAVFARPCFPCAIGFGRDRGSFVSSIRIQSGLA